MYAISCCEISEVLYIFFFRTEKRHTRFTFLKTLKLPTLVGKAEAALPLKKSNKIISTLFHWRFFYIFTVFTFTT